MGIIEGPGYQKLAGEFGLLNPIPQPADDVVAKVCERFANATPTDRDRIRGGISESDFYALMTFGERSAVFALRRNDPQMIDVGLNAVAMVERDRYDFRDFRYENLPAAAMTLGLNTDAIMKRAVSKAESKTANAMSNYSVVGKNALRRLVKTKFGYGFLSPFGSSSKEAISMLPVGIEIAEFVERSGRYIAEIDGAGMVPDVWFRNRSAKEFLASMKSAISIRSTLSAEALPELSGELRFLTWLNVWLINFGDSKSPRALSEMAAQAKTGNAVIAGVPANNSLALIVACTSGSGAKSIETSESVAILAAGIEKILREQ